MLTTLVTSFTDETRDIEDIFLKNSGHIDVHCSIMPYKPIDDGCLVSLWDAWSRFLRSFYLACASGPVVGVAGSRYVPGTARSEANALSHLATVMAQRGSGIPNAAGEPKWFVVSAADRICAALALANTQTVTAALWDNTVSLGGGFVIPNPLEEIRIARNYVAHKGRANLLEVQGFAGASLAHLSTYMRSRTAGGRVRFSEWVDAMNELAWNAAL